MRHEHKSKQPIFREKSTILLELNALPHHTLWEEKKESSQYAVLSKIRNIFLVRSAQSNHTPKSSTRTKGGTRVAVNRLHLILVSKNIDTFILLSSERGRGGWKP